MKLSFFRSRQRDATIHALYGMIVAQARSSSFYRDYGIADTVNGRFDMIVLHCALFLNRVAAGSPEVKAMGQRVFDLFCQDMDGNLREMGTGDLAVPKEVRRMAEAFYGRAAAYRSALQDNDNAALVEALTRNVFEGQSAARAGQLAAYVRAAVSRLQAQDVDAFETGHLDWPDPDPISFRGGR